MVYYSQAQQDEFVANILNFKRNGYYLDIGSYAYNAQSNSYFFETELNWKGICVEIGPQYAVGYENRNCHFLNTDATQIDYKAVLIEKNFPNRLDYLSIDVDDSTLASLKKLPLNDYRFSVITIEHDSYRFNDTLKNEERAILNSHNYTMLFSDVLVPLGCGMGPNLSFEDWWVDASIFNMDKLSKLGAARMYPDDIVAMMKSKKEIWIK